MFSIYSSVNQTLQNDDVAEWQNRKMFTNLKFKRLMYEQNNLND